jgi:RNA polymerase sigma-70 factor (ECF subfamily)
MMDSTTRLTDGELIAGSLEHPERFGLVFDRHFAAIHRYLARRAGRQAADDLAVDTFVVALGRRHTFHTSRDDARPWLFGIAANLMRDRWRAEERQLRAWERAGAERAAEIDTDSVVERADASAAGSVVGLALASLDARDRETLTLFVWADLSYEEIAEALAIPAGTVRSRIHRARRQVRGILAAHGVGVLSAASERQER